MRIIKLILGFAALQLLAACVAGGNDGVLQSATTPTPQQQQIAQTDSPAIVGQELPPVSSGDPALVPPSAAPQPAGQQPQIAYSDGLQPPAPQPPGLDGNRQTAFAAGSGTVTPYLRPRTKKTYLINGLASSIESIGYGFTNLSKKIPGSVLHNYASFVESSTIIRSQVTRELKAAYRSDPSVEINLIGISFGANIVTLIAADLDRSGIPVNYLVTMEGPAMVAIRDNVSVSDNFSCTNLDCFRTTSKLAFGNKTTDFETFKVKTSHIPLADHPDVHRRILGQLNRPREPLVAVQ